MKIPPGVPTSVEHELRESEACFHAGRARAASAMARSALEKLLRANGYDTGNLVQKIDAAHADGIITLAHQKRAHSDIRTLGNDILHEEWREVSAEEVQLAHTYLLWIIQDFYGSRPEIEEQLAAKGRKYTPVAKEGQ